MMYIFLQSIKLKKKDKNFEIRSKRVVFYLNKHKIKKPLISHIELKKQCYEIQKFIQKQNKSKIIKRLLNNKSNNI